MERKAITILFILLISTALIDGMMGGIVWIGMPSASYLVKMLPLIQLFMIIFMEGAFFVGRKKAFYLLSIVTIILSLVTLCWCIGSLIEGIYLISKNWDFFQAVRIFFRHNSYAIVYVILTVFCLTKIILLIAVPVYIHKKHFEWRSDILTIRIVRLILFAFILIISIASFIKDGIGLALYILDKGGRIARKELLIVTLKQIGLVIISCLIISISIVFINILRKRENIFLSAKELQDQTARKKELKLARLAKKINRLQERKK